MKKVAIALLTLGVLAAPAGFAAAQDYPSSSINPPYRYAPGAADAPMHGTHDKARAVREDNANGIFNEDAAAGHRNPSDYMGYYNPRR
jgi:hypothetical protein